MNLKRAIGQNLCAVRTTALSALTGFTLLCGPASGALAGEEPFPLVAAVPNDFFLVTGGRETPESAFLRVHQDRVWEAFVDSGFSEGLLELVLTQADEGVRTEVDRVLERFQGLCDAVDWSSLGQKEVVFAERLKSWTMVEGGPPIMMPDIAVLFRVEADAAEATHRNLVAILEAAVEEAGAMAGVPLAVEWTSAENASWATFDMGQSADEIPALPMTIGRRGNVLSITMGPGVHEEIDALIAGRGEGQSLAESERFRAALSSVSAPREGFVYVDMQILHTNLEEIADSVLGLVEANLDEFAGDSMTNTRKNPEASRLNREGFAAYEAGDHAEALRLTTAAHEVDPSDSTVLYNLSCLNALMGHPDIALDWLDKAVDGGFHAPRRIAADEDLVSLRGEERYAAALKRARLEVGPGPHEWVDAGRIFLLERVIGALGALDYSMTSYRTEGHSVHADTVTRLTASARQNPIYPALTSSRPVEDFARYLPAETLSYQVSAGGGVDTWYDYLVDSVAATGPLGAEALGAWEGIQGQVGFDIHTDVLDWIDGEAVQAAFLLDGEESWLWRMRVRNEETALEKLEFGLELASEGIKEAATENPMLGMFQIDVQPIEHEVLKGFSGVRVGMMPAPLICGVRDGWLIVASSVEAVLHTEATASGELPNVRENAALMVAGVVPTGPVISTHYTDNSKDGETAAEILRGLAMGGGMVAAMIPDPDQRVMFVKVLQLVGDLAPVMEEFDFQLSSSAAITFDGESWRQHGVINYAPLTTAEATTEKEGE